jgi:hypothetical protein
MLDKYENLPKGSTREGFSGYGVRTSLQQPRSRRTVCLGARNQPTAQESLVLEINARVPYSASMSGLSVDTRSLRPMPEVCDANPQQRRQGRHSGTSRSGQRQPAHFRQARVGGRDQSANWRMTLMRSDFPSNPMPGSSGITMWLSCTVTPSGRRAARSWAIPQTSGKPARWAARRSWRRRTIRPGVCCRCCERFARRAPSRLVRSRAP